MPSFFASLWVVEPMGRDVWPRCVLPPGDAPHGCRPCSCTFWCVFRSRPPPLLTACFAPLALPLIGFPPAICCVAIWLISWRCCIGLVRARGEERNVRFGSLFKGTASVSKISLSFPFPPRYRSRSRLLRRSFFFLSFDLRRVIEYPARVFCTWGRQLVL